MGIQIVRNFQRLGFAFALFMTLVCSMNHLQQRSNINAALKDFDNIKFDRKNSCLWYYSGKIKSFWYGKDIIGIEGIEYSRKLSKADIVDLACVNPSFKIINEQTTCLPYYSTKVFFYKNLSDPDNLLTSFKVSPIAPSRTIQSMNSMSHVSVLFAAPSNSLRTLLIFPPNRTVISDPVNVSYLFDGRSMSFSHHVESPSLFLGTSNSSVIQLSDKAPKSGWLSNRWISFTPQKSLVRGRTYEEYIFTKDSSRLRWLRKFFPGMKSFSQINYRRMGEIPPWLGLQKPSIIELTGRVLNDWNEVPPSIRQYVCVGERDENHSNATATSSSSSTTLGSLWNKLLIRKSPSRGYLWVPSSMSQWLQDSNEKARSTKQNILDNILNKYIF